MNIRFLHGTALVAGLGAAIALAGCNGNGSSATGGGSTGVSSANGSDAVATVGNSTITHADLGALLETRYGQQTLPYLIDTQLVLQAGQEKGVAATDADVEADLQRRAKTDPGIEQLLKTPGPTVDFAKQQVKRELTMQRLLTQGVKADDAKVKAFFTKYQTYYGEPARLKVGLLVSSTKARADAMSRALASKAKTFEALVEEQKANRGDAAGAAASIADRGQFETVDNFPPTLAAQLAKVPKGGVTQPIAQGTGLSTPIYIIFKVVDRQVAKKGDFTALHSVAETDYKMAQVAQTEVKKNPKNPPFDVALDRTKAYLASQQPGAAPTLRDVLTTMLQPASTNLIQSLQTKGTVQISDPNYTSLAPQYQPPTAAGTPRAAPGAGTPGASTSTAGASTAGSSTAAAPAAGTTPAATAAG